ncbi:MAG: TolC family protein, partial [Verrucomicrobiales bacterium]
MNFPALQTAGSATAALLLSGCLALLEPGPVSEAGLTAPEAYRSASSGNQGKISTGWVATFHDRDLSNLVDEALEHNLDIQEASANLEASNQSRKIARAARLPSLGFSADAGRTQRGDGFLVEVEPEPEPEPAPAPTTTTTTVAPDGTTTTSTTTTPAAPMPTARTGGSSSTGVMSLTSVDYGLSLQASW